MKRTVRVFCAAFAAALSLSLISGCKPGDATESGTSGSETKKNVTLTLASWEVNALKAPWMAKFTEKHPEIKVELAEEGKWLGTEDLAKLAAANKMPDIINVENIYVLSKKRFRGKGILFTINTMALMFVPQAVQIPRYLIIEKSHLIDNFLILFLPLLAMPVGLFLVKQFIDQVPDALIEAARIDGAGDFRIVTSIIAPIVKPALATVAILAFQASWNNAEISTYYVNNDMMRTFAFYLSSMIVGMGNNVAGRGILAAATLVMFIPNLLIFIFMQNKVLNTMAHSGIK